jgi:SAM-dependent methyltransferase
MSKSRSGARWDQAFSAGKYAFLHKPSEKARLKEIAEMIGRSIAEKGRCEIVDIGCGEGLLLDYLAGLDVARYVGVDVSAVALSRLPDSVFPVAAINASLAQWHGDPPPRARRILVASEVLYYDEHGIADLAHFAADGVSEIIISCVGGRHDKPNWTAASRKLWREIASAGWTLIETRRLSDEATGIDWDIARYAV